MKPTPPFALYDKDDKMRMFGDPAKIAVFCKAAAKRGEPCGVSDSKARAVGGSVLSGGVWTAWWEGGPAKPADAPPEPAPVEACELPPPALKPLPIGFPKGDPRHVTDAEREKAHARQIKQENARFIRENPESNRARVARGEITADEVERQNREFMEQHNAAKPGLTNAEIGRVIREQHEQLDTADAILRAISLVDASAGDVPEQLWRELAHVSAIGSPLRRIADALRAVLAHETDNLRDELQDKHTTEITELEQKLVREAVEHHAPEKSEQDGEWDFDDVDGIAKALAEAREELQTAKDEKEGADTACDEAEHKADRLDGVLVDALTKLEDLAQKHLGVQADWEVLIDKRQLALDGKDPDDPAPAAPSGDEGLARKLTSRINGCNSAKLLGKIANELTAAKAALGDHYGAVQAAYLARKAVLR